MSDAMAVLLMRRFVVLVMLLILSCMPVLGLRSIGAGHRYARPRRPWLLLHQLQVPAATRSAHLALHNGVETAPALPNDPPAPCGSSKVLIHEFADKHSNSTLMATCISKQALELFSLHLYQCNLSDGNAVYRQVEADISNSSAFAASYKHIWDAGRFLSSSPSFFPQDEDRERSVDAVIQAGILTYTHFKGNHAMRAAVHAFLHSMQQLAGHPLEHYFYTPELGLGNLETLKQFTAWIRDEFPYFRGQCAVNNEHGLGEHLGYVVPTADEIVHLALSTELFYCSECNGFSRFPRYVDVSKVLATRRGRCGEYSMLMLLCAEALHYRVRYLAEAGHVWVEVLIGNDWYHVDPCEAAVNEPLLYQGWGKQPTFILAFSEEGVEDRTSHYTDHPSEEVIGRRLQKGVSEEDLVRKLGEATDELKRRLTASEAAVKKIFESKKGSAVDGCDNNG